MPSVARTVVVEPGSGVWRRAPAFADVQRGDDREEAKERDQEGNQSSAIASAAATPPMRSTTPATIAQVRESVTP